MFQTLTLALSLTSGNKIFFDIQHTGDIQLAVQLKFCNCTEFYPVSTSVTESGCYDLYVLSSSSISYSESGSFTSLESVEDLAQKLSDHYSSEYIKVYHSLINTLEVFLNGIEHQYHCRGVPERT